MTNEWTEGETPELDDMSELTDGEYQWCNLRDPVSETDMDEAEYVQVDYPTRPYRDVTSDNWSDCIYCGGSPAIQCQYNHVEARPLGDARRTYRGRESYVTSVADCNVKCDVFLTPAQRYTSYKPLQGQFLRRGC